MQKLCKFIIGPANHRISSATTCPFNVFGSAWGPVKIYAQIYLQAPAE